MRIFSHVNKQTKKRLNQQFSWLNAVCDMQTPAEISCLSISYFDHWLSDAEANAFLVNVLAEEQKKRDTLFFSLMLELVEQFEIYAFTFVGCNQSRVVFKRFVSDKAAALFFLPKSLAGTRCQKIQLVLPQHEVIFFEGYDDTSHLYFKNDQNVLPILDLAKKLGLHSLVHNDSTK